VKDQSYIYVSYYAAKLPGVSDGTQAADTTGIYGDLNGLNGSEPWLCLYYARDLRVSSPLTPSMLIKTAENYRPEQTRYYCPIHDFSIELITANTPYDLNSTSTKVGAASILVFLRRSSVKSGFTATVMEHSTLLIAVGTFLAGAGISFAVTWVVMKKKKTKGQG